MLRKLLPIDVILKSLPLLPNVVNRQILKLNRFPNLLYGASYVEKKEQLGAEGDYEKEVVKTVNQAIQKVPYYQKRYDPIQNFSEFQKGIGFIDKAEVLENLEDFMAMDINLSNYVFGTTGGTSGKPMKLIIPKDRYNFELPTVHSYWNDYGWNFHLRGVIRNHKLPKHKKYLINPVTKEIIFDAFRIDEEYVKEIVLVLKKYNVQYIQAYPSAAFLFCSLSKKMGLSLNFLQAIFTSSEAILDFQQNLIVDEMKIPIFNLYGHSEKLIIAGQCKFSDHMHFEPSYGYAELVDKSGNQITSPGEIGELVGTSFHNPGVPLIRYKTGDYAEYVGGHCPSCGKKGLTARNIKGHHTKNLIYRKNNTYTSSTALNLHGDLLRKIDGMQYLQDKKGQLKILLIKNVNFNEKDHADFIDHFKRAMGEDSEVIILYVSKLKSLPNGKFPLLISKIAK